MQTRFILGVSTPPPDLESGFHAHKKAALKVGLPAPDPEKLQPSFLYQELNLDKGIISQSSRAPTCDKEPR